jgi:hypothetical protein
LSSKIKIKLKEGDKMLKKILLIFLFSLSLSCTKEKTDYEQYFSEVGFFEKHFKMEFGYDFDKCIYFNGKIKTKKNEKLGTVILDVSKPKKIKYIASVEKFGYGISLADKKLYIANWENGIDVYNVKRPHKSKFLYHYGKKWGADKKLFLNDNYLYSFGEDGLEIIEQKKFKAERVQFLAGNWRSGGLASYQNYLYVAVNTDYIYEIRILDLTDPKSPQIKNYISYTASKLYVYGQDLYVCTGTKVFILDLKDPENPELKSVISEYAKDIECFENYLVIANDFKNIIYIYDITDIKIPKKIAEISEIEKIDSFTINNGILYIAQKNKGLSVYDIKSGKPKFMNKKQGEFYNLISSKHSKYID